MVRVCQCIEEARAQDEIITVFLDELTFYQHPTLANDWRLIGKSQPLARLGYKGDKKRRVIGALNVVTGEVTFDHHPKIGVCPLVSFCKQIRKKYHSAKTIYVIMDNWPIHYHPKVVQAATENELQFIPLPTYAPWTNPIEKLWRWLYQDILHLHRNADQWNFLIQRVSNFLNGFEEGSEDLLKYVGLSQGKIPAAPLNWKGIAGYPTPAINDECEIILLSDSKTGLPV